MIATDLFEADRLGGAAAASRHGGATEQPEAAVAEVDADQVATGWRVVAETEGAGIVDTENRESAIGAAAPQGDGRASAGGGIRGAMAEQANQSGLEISGKEIRHGGSAVAEGEAVVAKFAGVICCEKYGFAIGG